MAGQVHLRKHEPHIPRGIPPRALMRWGTFLKLFAPVFARLGISLDGIEGQETANGLHLRGEITPSADTPWSISYGDGEVTIGSGVVQGHIVDEATFSLPSSGTRYVYVILTEDLTANHGFVNSFAWTSGALAIGSSVPSDDMEAGTYHIPLLEFVDGVLNTRYESTSLGFRVIDDGTSTSKGRGEYYPA